MISSNVFQFERTDVWYRNYVAMSFYLIDAFEHGRDFSLLGYATNDSIEFRDLYFEESDYSHDVYLNALYSRYTGELKLLSSATCPVCGKGMKIKYDHAKLTNEAFCEQELCNDILEYFNFSMWNTKGKNQSTASVKSVAKLIGVTPSTAAKKINECEYNQLLGDAMTSVFLLAASKDSKLAKSKFYSFREIEEKYGILNCNLVKSQNENQTLYGIKFPKAIKDNFDYRVPKAHFYKWAEQCNGEI